MNRPEDVLARSPFRSSSVEPTILQRATQSFFGMFQLAVLTDNPKEEAWAYRECLSAFREAMGSPPASSTDPDMPAGFFEAMQWAAELMVATSASRR